jgi:hypothetical protein
MLSTIRSLFVNREVLGPLLHPEVYLIMLAASCGHFGKF